VSVSAAQQNFPFPTAIYDDAEALARGAVHRLLETVNSAQSDRVSVCLSGGSTPKRMYELLATEFLGEVPWNRVHWFFGDERLVPPDDKDSNYRMAREAMFDRAPAPAENIHPIPTAGLSAEEAADAYAAELQRFHGAAAFGPGQPLFDVLLLGLGSDGHTASLFPGKPGILERSRWVVGVPEAGLSPFVPRVSLSLPALESSHLTLFLVSGAGKQPVLERIARGEELPAAQVAGEPPPLWMLDREAAAALA
jgi:6-phosphogluconolactonase